MLSETDRADSYGVIGTYCNHRQRPRWSSRELVVVWMIAASGSGGAGRLERGGTTQGYDRGSESSASAEHVKLPLILPILKITMSTAG